MAHNRFSKKQVFLGLWSILWLLLSFEIIAEKINQIKIESIDAKEIISMPDGSLKFSGEVIVKTNILTIKANEALFNEALSSLSLIGKVYIETSNVNISGKKIIANFSNQFFIASEAEYLLKNGVKGTVQEAIVNSSGDLNLKNVTYTNCNVDDPFWTISSDKISLLKEKENAVIRGIKLKIKDLSIFYLPILRTAIGNKRMSGFLAPSINQSSKGLDISIPYYFNIAPNFDLVLSPRVISSRGEGISSNFRYLTKNTNGKILLSGINDDKEFKKNTGQISDRWLVQWNHKSSFYYNWSSNIDFTSASDPYYFKDIGDDQYGQRRTSYLNKSAMINWKNQNITFSLGFNRFQNMNSLSVEEFRSQPNLTLKLNKKFQDLIYKSEIRLDRFKTEKNLLFKNEDITIDRTFFSNSLKYSSLNRSSSSFIELGTDFKKHKLKEETSSKNTFWTIIESKVFLDKNTLDSYSSFSPLIRYVYSEEEDALFIPLIDSQKLPFNYYNLLRGNIYSGYDKRGPANNLIIGLEYFSSSNNNLDTEFMIGQAIYLDDDIYKFNSKNINNSPTVAEYSVNIKNTFKSQVAIEWNHKSNKMDAVYLSLVYKKTDSIRTELRTIFRRNIYKNEINLFNNSAKIKQIEGIFEIPLGPSWNFFSRWHKDLVLNKSIDMMYGAEFKNCCLKIGIMNRRWDDLDYYSLQKNFLLEWDPRSPQIKSKNSIFITIELIGLGRIGKNFTKAISSSRLQ